jgi:hypothetical protein
MEVNLSLSNRWFYKTVLKQLGCRLMRQLFADCVAHIIAIKDPHRYADERIVTQE